MAEILGDAKDNRVRELLEHFVSQTRFQDGCICLDLDGTALLEGEGRIFASGLVEHGLKKVHDLAHPIILNTLRFPLSVMQAVGKEWYELIDTPIPTVLLDGSMIGYIRRVGNDTELDYEEIASFPMLHLEVKEMLDGIAELVKNNIRNIKLFYYTRDWREGETLWTPDQDRVPELQMKHRNASSVISCEVNRLRELMGNKEVCMVSVLVDSPADQLMAYQHSEPHDFFTHQGVDKAFGLREIAQRFGISLANSFGAGDTEMDNFLQELGLAIIVGDRELPFAGKIGTVRVNNPQALGKLVTDIVGMIKQI